MTQEDNRLLHSPGNRRPVYVYQLPQRIWHWTHALSFFALAATGYLIARPLPSLAGEASDYFLMGDVRLVHFVSAYVFAVGFVLRAYWALVGNRYAREVFVLPLRDRHWWQLMLHELRFYLFLERRVFKTPGHGPLGQATMFIFNTLGTLFMCLTGFALFAAALGTGSWADVGFGWITPLAGGLEATHNWHNLGMWLMLTFVIIHIYMAIRADIMSRQSSLSTLICGWRMFRDDLPYER